MSERASSRPLVFVAAVLICMATDGLALGQDGLRYDLAEKFGFTCETVELSARLRKKPAGDNIDPNTLSHDLTISVHLDIRYTNDLVGMAVDNARILEVLDGNGQSIQRIPDASESLRQHVEVRFRSIQENFSRVQKLKPSEVPIRLHFAPNSRIPSVLSKVHGYVYALYADDIIEVDVPFEPVGKRVEVAPGLEIEVDRMTPPPPGPVKYEPRTRPVGPIRPAGPLAICWYGTIVESTTDKPVRALGDSLKDEQAFGTYAVIRSYPFDTERPSRLIFETQSVTGYSSLTDGKELCYVYCHGQIKQNSKSYDMIRHDVAVNLREVKIPFTLTNVPVPSLATAARSGGE